MKYLILLITVSFLFTDVTAKKKNPKYDSKLAKALNGNDNGMKKYFLVILKTGSNQISDTAIVDSIFSGHMKNIGRLADNGSLVVAGPLGKNDKTYRGIFILNASTLDEAEKLLSTDPAVNSKMLEGEFYSLWCTAALQSIPGIHEKITKYKE
jgi:uncharacterized protein YciI